MRSSALDLDPTLEGRRSFVFFPLLAIDLPPASARASSSRRGRRSLVLRGSAGSARTWRTPSSRPRGTTRNSWESPLLSSAPGLPMSIRVRNPRRTSPLCIFRMIALWTPSRQISSGPISSQIRGNQGNGQISDARSVPQNVQNVKGSSSSSHQPSKIQIDTEFLEVIAFREEYGGCNARDDHRSDTK